MIGPKTWDRVVRIFGIFGETRDCPENKWAVRVLNSGNFSLKCMYLYGKRPGMGGRIGPKTWDRIMEIFGDFGLSVTVQKSVVG